MDFLDPKAKRNRNIRLLIGYALMTILILTATTILVFSAYGFDVDRKTGNVIQNGLVFVDSAPDGATILLNGKDYKDNTNTRISLPEGTYNLVVKKQGYRDWSRTFTLEGGHVERFTYPLLIQSVLSVQDVAGYDTMPSFVTQTPDRRYTITSVASSLTSFIEYDLNNLSNKKPATRNITYSPELFTKAEGAHSLELVEWSNDNKHIMVKHNFIGGSEFVLLSRDAPETSINVNKYLAQNPTDIALRDKKFDQWYIYTAVGGLLSAVDVKTKAVVPVVSGVGVFKSHDTETIIYTLPVAGAKTQRVMLKVGKETYLLREISVGKAMLDIARYDGAWYVAVGSEVDKKTYVYKDPQTVLSRNKGTKPAPLAVLRATGDLSAVSFSQNTRFIVSQSGQHFEVYDTEYKKVYKFEQAKAFDAGAKVVWMDGHRLLGRRQGKIVIFDFDGSNTQELIANAPNAPAMFDRDYTVLYTVPSPVASTPKTILGQTQLRTKADQ